MPRTFELRDSGATEPVAIPVGDTFEVRLQENRTTGFRWKIAASGQPECRLLDDHFVAGAAVGGEGTHTWRFQAGQRGETSIRMVLERPWEHDAKPAKTFDLRISVTG